MPITKFHAFALLQFAGDHAAAAAALRQAGSGSRTNKPSPVVDHPPAEANGTRPNPIGDGVSPTVTSTRVVQPPPHVETWGPSEDGLARALVAHHGHELRYCPQRGRWLVWTGYRWLWDEAGRHREYVRAFARQLPSGEGWWRFRARALSAAGVSGIARMAQTDPSLTVHVGQPDAHPYELNTPAGIVDLRSGELRGPDPTRLHPRIEA
ncbi:hypothetical protein Raf01_87140 [Rugosimonospora africana]|uniref:Bacteriophage/plasmid primase P4 C-terminal domain-containing protein n=1 Tax=Rugosimonospora africana TaxID=556532 RepID=A0A8J3R290_9ACTN|nr:hypothetical protein Raf01_87140 [Rugosimonospora africana]